MPTGSTVFFSNTVLLLFCQSTVTPLSSPPPPIHVPPLYRVPQELRSLPWDLIPEVILSQKRPIQPD